mgnify:CR=1 FL=1
MLVLFIGLVLLDWGLQPQLGWDETRQFKCNQPIEIATLILNASFLLESLGDFIYNVSTPFYYRINQNHKEISWNQKFLYEL